VSVEFFELGDGKRESLGMSTFTKADLERAESGGMTAPGATKNMRSRFPRNLMFARAMSNGVRWYCPDVFLGSAVYVPEELGAEVDEETGEILQGEYTIAPQRPLQYVGPAPERGRKVDFDKVPERVTDEELAITRGVVPSLDDDVQFDDDGPDGPFDDAPTDKDKPTEKARKRFHALGSELYGAGWDDKRAELVASVTGGKYTSASMLTAAQTSKLSAGMDAKLAQQAQPDAKSA